MAAGPNSSSTPSLLTHPSSLFRALQSSRSYCAKGSQAELIRAPSTVWMPAVGLPQRATCCEAATAAGESTSRSCGLPNGVRDRRQRAGGWARELGLRGPSAVSPRAHHHHHHHTCHMAKRGSSRQRVEGLSLVSCSLTASPSPAAGHMRLCHVRQHESQLSRYRSAVARLRRSLAIGHCLADPRPT